MPKKPVSTVEKALRQMAVRNRTTTITNSPLKKKNPQEESPEGRRYAAGIGLAKAASTASLKTGLDHVQLRSIRNDDPIAKSINARLSQGTIDTRLTEADAKSLKVSIYRAPTHFIN